MNRGEDSDQKSEAGVGSSEFGMRNAECGSRRAEVGGPKSEAGDRKSETSHSLPASPLPASPLPASRTPHSAFRIPNSSLRALAVPLALGLIVLAGFAMRMEDLREWMPRHDQVFFEGKPLLSALDGYYYLRLARDLTEGCYVLTDPLRNAPHQFVRPRPPPLLSVLTAAGAWVSRAPIEWVALVLPAMLGPLLAIPLFFLARSLAGRTAGLVAAFMGVMAPYYVYRSDMGWLDTDCMNVTWALGAVACFAAFVPRDGRPRPLWLVAGLAVAVAAVWWWDQARFGALLITLGPLAGALLFLDRRAWRSRPALWSLGGVLVLSLTLAAFQPVREFAASQWHLMMAHLTHLAKAGSDAFPSLAQSVSEQTPATLSYAVGATTRSAITFAIGLAGLLWIAVRRTRTALLLLPVAALAALSFSAERFLIYLAPLIALGLGVATQAILRMADWVRRVEADLRCALPPGAPRLADRAPALLAWVSGILFAVLLASVVATGAPPTHTILTGVTAWPKTEANRVAGMAGIMQKTPTNALVWTWWDNGYGVAYWSRRATLSDGQVHGGDLSYYLAAPLVSTNVTFAANFIRFFSTHGRGGVDRVVSASAGRQTDGWALLERILSAGPENAPAIFHEPPLSGSGTPADWQSYFFPTSGPPVYLFLDTLMRNRTDVWYTMGTWDPVLKAGRHAVYEPIDDVDVRQDMVIRGGELLIDPINGTLRHKGTLVALTHLLVREKNQAWVQDFGRTHGGRFEVMAPRRFGVLMSAEIAESVFNRLFLRMDPAMAARFIPVLEQSPDYQLWEVK